MNLNLGNTGHYEDFVRLYGKRSPVAEALLTKFNPQIDVSSAGTHAYHRIIDVSRDYLAKQDAEQHLKDVPEQLDSKPLRRYDG